jgi:hypothetical protein
MLLLLLLFLFLQTMSAQPASKNKNNGFGYLRRQVLELQNKNERLESNMAKLTDAIDRLTTVIHKMSDENNNETDNENHYKYICDRIVEKIQDSLVFPKQKKKFTILDRDAGIIYQITKKGNDKNVIGSNMILKQFNPKAKNWYVVEFFVYAKFEENDKFLLTPTFKSEEDDESLYVNSESGQQIDFFGYSYTKSVYFPRTFYETINANGEIDVAEY